MPYIFVPEGHYLQKVTKQEEAAVKETRRHDDFKAFLGSPQSGTAVGGVAVGIALLVFIIPIIKKILSLLATDKDFKGKTVGQILANEKDFSKLYLTAFSGIPETLIGVVIPGPIQEEIKRQTGLDIGGLFSQLRGEL